MIFKRALPNESSKRRALIASATTLAGSGSTAKVTPVASAELSTCVKVSTKSSQACASGFPDARATCQQGPGCRCKESPQALQWRPPMR